jgi:putative endonuclease
MKKRDGIGEKGEQAARQYLREQGYQLIQHNWACPFGEIDIIARDGDTLVFVEVKVRTRSDYGGPEGALTVHKQRKIVAASRMYLAGIDTDIPVRYDLVTIQRGKIKLMKNAFLLEDRCTPTL